VSSLVKWRISLETGKAAIMNTRTINSLLRTSAGTLSDVDLVNRTIQVRVGPTALFFDVPRECEIVLNGERVKLHVLQSNDPVQVIHGPGPCDITAKRLEVVSQKHSRGPNCC
jgi:hypothetical protein